MIGVDWVFELWKRIGTARRPIELNDFRVLVAEHCPFKDGVPYLSVVATGNLGQDMVNALNAGEYWKATVLAVSRNDELYGENVEMKKKNDKYPFTVESGILLSEQAPRFRRTFGYDGEGQ